MIVLIDNYDSFSYNLVQMIGSIEPDIKVVRNDQVTVDDIESMKPSHLILSPGPGYPRDAGILEEAVIKLKGKMPFWACAWDIRVYARLSAEPLPMQRS